MKKKLSSKTETLAMAAIGALIGFTTVKITAKIKSWKEEQYKKAIDKLVEVIDDLQKVELEVAVTEDENRVETEDEDTDDKNESENDK
mgnify:CR=1 FL=1|jgi:D-serine dehydratase